MLVNDAVDSVLHGHDLFSIIHQIQNVLLLAPKLESDEEFR